MARLFFSACVLLAIAGCSSMPGPGPGVAPSACEGGNENAWACQIQRYHDVAAE